MKRLLAILSLIPTTAFAQNTWGSANNDEPKGFSWTDPLWPDFWMAWTPATLMVFVGIFSAMGIIAALEIGRWRDGLERTGILGLTTTLGDRLFISLLGSAWIFIAWLGFFGTPLWIPLGLAILWGIFCFWKV